MQTTIKNPATMNVLSCACQKTIAPVFATAISTVATTTARVATAIASLIVLSILAVLPPSTASAQGALGAEGAPGFQNSDDRFSLRSVSISIGSYQPSFDYFDRTAWNFNDGTMSDIRVEWNLIRPLSVVGGVGYFNLFSRVKRGDLAYEEQLVYDMLPLSLGFTGRFRVDAITIPGVDTWNLYLNSGADLFLISATYRYCVCAPETTKRGSTLAMVANAGAELTFNRFAFDLFAGYRLGEFEQSLQFNEDSEPSTEGISLTGFTYGIRLAYLF